MSEQNKPICVEQILVSLDNSKHSFSALKAAVELAHHYDAKVKGVFVYDTKLIRLAETQFLYEVSEYTAISRTTTVDEITHGMIAQSRWIMKAFHKLINQTGLDGDFIVKRGNIDEIIYQESEKCDLIIIGKSGTHPMKRPRVGSTARSLIQHVRKSLLLIEEDSNLGYPMFVLFLDSTIGWKSLETACELLGQGEKLNIILEDTNPEELEKNANKIRNWAKEKKINISFETTSAETFGRFLEKIGKLRTGLVILPMTKAHFSQKIIEEFLKEIPIPILLVKSSE